MAAVRVAALLQVGQNLPVLGVVRLHGHGPADVLQGGDSVACAVVGQGAEVIPLAVPGLRAVQGVERLLIPAVLDVPVSGLGLGGVKPGLLLPLLLPPPAEDVLKGISAVACPAAVTGPPSVGPAAVAGGVRLGRILDLFVGGVDLLHLPGSSFVAGVCVGVVLFCQTAVGLFDLLVGRAPLQPQYLVGIVDHVGSSCAAPRAFFSFLLYVTQMPLYKMLSSSSLSWTRGSIS